jgi:hypothetical protein
MPSQLPPDDEHWHAQVRLSLYSLSAYQVPLGLGV